MLPLNSIPKINFTDQELAEHLLTNILLTGDLSYINFSVDFFNEFFPKEDIFEIIKIFFTVLVHTDKEQANKLIEENAPPEKVLEFFCKQLNCNLEANLVVFQIFKEEILDKKQNPLEKLLQDHFIQEFVKGLKLSDEETVFFILNLLNAVWTWIFFDFTTIKSNEKNYQATLNSLGISSQTSITTLNEKLKNLFLLDRPFSVSPFVLDFFSAQNQNLYLQEVNVPSQTQDCLDYNEVSNLNKTELTLFKKILENGCCQNKPLFLCLHGTNSFRLENFLLYSFSNIYKFDYKSFPDSKKEFFFYLYALSLECSQRKACLYLPEEIVLLFEEYDGKDDFFLKEKKFNRKIGEFTSFLKCPIICIVENNSEQITEGLNEYGIDFAFSLKLVTPQETQESYQKQAIKFFGNNNEIPLSLLHSIVDESTKRNVPPQHWASIKKIFSYGESFSSEDVCEIIDNKFPYKQSIEQSIKKQLYSFDVLNTNPPINELITSLKNGKEFSQKNQEPFRCVVKLAGPSGTGKTAFATQICYELGIALKVVHASDLLGNLVGDTEKNIKAIFAKATSNHQAILLDEADSFLHERVNTTNTHENSKVNEFLMQMSDFNGLMFITTNRPDSLDKATDRRIHFHVDFKPVNLYGVKQLCETYFSEYCISENQQKILSSFEKLTPGDCSILYEKMKYLPQESKNNNYVFNELLRIIKSKERSYEKQIGFGCC